MPDVYFIGPVGRIEGRYHTSKQKNAPVALVLHPDPTQGGTMHNEVSYTIFKSFVETGFTVLRINFPGVGRSHGVLGNGETEFKVASVALDWLQHNNPEASHYWVGGFSFGSYIGMQLAVRRPEIEHFVVCAPPTPKFDFSFSVPCPLSGLVFSGGMDTIALPDSVATLVSEWSKRREFASQNHFIPDADHFFKGHLEEVFNIAVDYINTSLAMRVAKPVRKKRRKRRKRDKDGDDFDD